MSELPSLERLALGPAPGQPKRATIDAPDSPGYDSDGMADELERMLEPAAPRIPQDGEQELPRYGLGPLPPPQEEELPNYGLLGALPPPAPAPEPAPAPFSPPPLIRPLTISTINANAQLGFRVNCERLAALFPFFCSYDAGSTRRFAHCQPRADYVTQGGEYIGVYPSGKMVFGGFTSVERIQAAFDYMAPRCWQARAV